MPYYAGAIALNNYKTDKGYMTKYLTVAHINHGRPLYVLGREAEIEKIDFSNDMMILNAKKLGEKKTVKLLPEDGKYKLGEKIVIWGYHRGELMRWNRIVGKIKGGLIYLDVNIPHGVSGGGVFNSKNELIGIMIGKDSENVDVSIALSVFLIRRFLYE